jgi:hypothetical protein
VPDGGVARLSAQLDVPLAGLVALERFSDEQVAVISAAVQSALDTHRRELDESLEKTIGFVPRMLRRRARKLLLPGVDHG